MAFRNRDPTQSYSVAPTQWTNPDNILTDDTNSADRNLTAGQISGMLDGWDFNFTIPIEATINGIEVYYRKKADTADMRDYQIQLLDDVYAEVGDNKADIDTDWNNGIQPYQEVTYGSPTDDWNAGLTATQINHAWFACRLKCRYVYGFGDNNAHVRHMNITIWYSKPGSPRLMSQTRGAGEGIARGIS